MRQGGDDEDDDDDDAPMMMMIAVKQATMSGLTTLNDTTRH